MEDPKEKSDLKMMEMEELLVLFIILALSDRAKKRKNGLEHGVTGKGRPGERLSMGSQKHYEMIQHFRESWMGIRMQVFTGSSHQSKTGFFIYQVILFPCVE